MPLPVVAIVGRPNVGKSSLFNWLAGRRISIVDPTAGVTRDRLTTVVQTEGRAFELVDTGGMGIQDKDNLTEDVERQITYAIESASVVLFVVDVRDGMVPLDQDVANRLRKANKPVVFVANKTDDPKFLSAASDFFALGYGEPLCVSANQLLGKDDLFGRILECLPPDDGALAPTVPDLKIAIVGRRNVGKSTFINSLAKADRVIVSEVAGTTRDSVDVRFERDGKAFVAIDTAGVRKRKSLSGDIEFYSLHRAERSIRRADVVLMLFDPRLRVSRVDKQLAEYVVDNHKPAIFVVNKWDLVKEQMPTAKWADYLRQMFPMLDYVPIAFTTAKNGKNVYKLLNLAQQLHKQAGRRAKTGELNRVLHAAMEAMSPPVRHNRVAKVFYASQIDAHPPTIVLVTNGPELFDDTYRRYLTKTIRDSFRYGEVAIRLIFKSKGEAAGQGNRDLGDVPEVEIPKAEWAGPNERTEEIPALAGEPPVDELDPLVLHDPIDPGLPDVKTKARTRSKKPEPAKAPEPAPPPAAVPPAPRPKPSRKKKKPDTWNI